MNNENTSNKGSKEFRLCLYKERLETFHSWPYGKRSKCSAEKVAETGFYAVNPEKERDLAMCFFCLKELHWEEDDEPWVEHKSHSPNCAFIKLGKKESDLTLLDFTDLLLGRAIRIEEKKYEEGFKKMKAEFGAFTEKFYELSKS